MEAIEPGNGFSSCDDDPLSPLVALSHTCPGWAPRCYPECVSDADPDLPGLQPDCEIDVEMPDEPARSVPECRKNPDGRYPEDPEAAVPPGADFCARMLVDPAASPEPACLDDGLNLAVDFVRLPDTPVPSGTRFTGQCVPAEHGC
jgi:hypothetical protein